MSGWARESGEEEHLRESDLLCYPESREFRKIQRNLKQILDFVFNSFRLFRISSFYHFLFISFFMRSVTISSCDFIRIVMTPLST